MEFNWWVFFIGIFAQALFSARVILQWVLSERAKKVVSPAIYWELSLAATYLLAVYGWIRDDFSIIFGQLMTYYIFIWNLKMKGSWQKVHAIIQWIILILPVVIIPMVVTDYSDFVDKFFKNFSIPMWLLWLGVAGQFIYAIRFVYQWHYSVNKKESVLPPFFWMMSITGSVVIIVYAAIREDWALIAGHVPAVCAYSRNIWLHFKGDNSDYKLKVDRIKNIRIFRIIRNIGHHHHEE